MLFPLVVDASRTISLRQIDWRYIFSLSFLWPKLNVNPLRDGKIMTEIARARAANAGFIRPLFRMKSSSSTSNECKRNPDATAISGRRVEQAQGRSSDNNVDNPGDQNFDFGADNIQQEQVNTKVDISLERAENNQVQTQDENLRAIDDIEVSLNNAAQKAQNNINQQAVQDD